MNEETIKKMQSILFGAEQKYQDVLERTSALAEKLAPKLEIIQNNKDQSEAYRKFKEALFDPNKGFIPKALKYMTSVNHTDPEFAAESTTNIYEALLELQGLYGKIETMPKDLKKAWKEVFDILHTELMKGYISGRIHSTEPLQEGPQKVHKNRYRRAETGQGLKIPDKYKQYFN